MNFLEIMITTLRISHQILNQVDFMQKMQKSMPKPKICNKPRFKLKLKLSLKKWLLLSKKTMQMILKMFQSNQNHLKFTTSQIGSFKPKHKHDLLMKMTQMIFQTTHSLITI